jgi:hypothetical protein
MSMMAEKITAQPEPAAAAVPTPRRIAQSVEAKLRASERRLLDLQAEIDEVALSKALDENGAAERLAELNGKMQAAREEFEQLSGAHRLALRKDGQAEVKARARIRSAQLSAMQSHARARLAAMTDLCAAIETAAKASTRFLDSTDKMALATPTGMISHAIAWHDLDTMIDGRSFPAPIDKIVASEMFRHARDDGSRRYLPGAAPLIEHLRLQPAAIEPATEAVKRTNEYLLGSIKTKLESIEQADAAKVAGGA